MTTPKKVIQKYIRRKYSRKSVNWAGTCERACNQWMDFCEYDNIDMTGEINQYHIEDFIDWLNTNYDYAPKTLENKMMAITGLLQYANGRYGWEAVINSSERNNIFEASVDADYETRYEEETGDEIPYITVDEYEKLLEVNNNPRDDLLLRLLYDTGCRPIELVNATPDDVDLENRSLEVETAKKEKRETRDVYYKPSTKRKLGEWLYRGKRNAYSSCSYESDYILLTQRKPKMDVQLVNRQVKRLAERADIQETAWSRKTTHKLRGKEFETEREFVKINAKSFRHAFCVRAVRNGISLGMLQELSGHASAESLEPYLKFRDDDKRDAFDHYL